MENTGVVTQTFSADIPRYIISGVFDNDLCKDFLTFHTEAVRKGVTEAFLYINSPGGYLHSLSTMINLVSSGEIAYHTIAMGEACSAACILTAFGTFRWAVPETVFLFHDVSYGTWGNQKQIEEEVVTQKMFAEKIMARFAKQTNKSSDFWLDMAYSRHTNDFYFDSDKAVEYGLIDFVGMPSIVKQSQFVVELPVEMEEFEKLMAKRGVQSEHLTENESVKSPKKKTVRKTTKKRTRTKK